MTAFWIKGDDGEEYGPVELDELREWLRENRIGVDTPVRPDDGKSSWQAYQKFPELLALLAENRALNPNSGRNDLLLPAFYSARIAAYIIDSLVLASMAVLVVTSANPLLPLAWQVDPSSFAQLLISDANPNRTQAFFLLAILFIRLAYYTYFHGRNGQTPGKWLFGIRVVNGAGLTVSYRQAFIRAIGTIFSEMPWFAGYLIVFFTPYRRALHDLLAGTFVVQARKEKARLFNNK